MDVERDWGDDDVDVVAGVLQLVIFFDDGEVLVCGPFFHVVPVGHVVDGHRVKFGVDGRLFDVVGGGVLDV